MEQISLKVESIEPAKRKDGSPVEGISKKGVKWQLFKFNKKYSYFHHGEGLPDYTLGKEYPFDLETKQDGQYTNYQISRPEKKYPNPQQSKPITNESIELEFIKKGFGTLRGDIIGEKGIKPILERIEMKLDALLEGTGAVPDKKEDTIPISEPYSTT